MKIVVIIPTYNEAENIGRMLDVLVKREFREIKGHTMQILVVDSSSPDGTADVVREKMERYKQVSLLVTDKGGLGADYVKGMKCAMDKMKADVVIEFDADFQHDPKDIKRLIAAMDKGADLVIGSRYTKGGAIPAEWGLHRKLMSYFGSLFARVVLLTFKVHDMTSGMKLTKSSYLGKVDLDNLYSKYYAYKIHILYEIYKMGAKIAEVPIVFHERKEGTSKISRKDLIDSFLVVVKLRIRDSKSFIKFGIVGFVGYLINAVGLELFARLPLTSSLAQYFIMYKNNTFLGVLTQPSAWAAALATELAIISNYNFNNFWTFSQDKITVPGRYLWKFLHFNLTSLGAVVIQFLTVGFAVLLFGDTHIIRQAALFLGVVFLVVPYNYTMYNIFIWKRWRVPGLGFIQDRNLVKS